MTSFLICFIIGYLVAFALDVVAKHVVMNQMRKDHGLPPKPLGAEVKHWLAN